jgi:hypothetical protein
MSDFRIRRQDFALIGLIGLMAGFIFGRLVLAIVRALL